MSQIAILGASGPLGKHLLAEALDAGWLVHAQARDPSLVHMANERLTLYQGAPEDGSDLEELVAGCRYVIYAVDTARPADGVACLVKAVGFKLIERIVYLSRPGTGSAQASSRKSHGVLASLLPKVRLGSRAAEEDRAEELLRLSGLPYCVFHVTEIDDAAHGRELLVTSPKEPTPGPVGRADFARFVVHSLGDRSWNLKEVTVGTRRAQD